MILYNENFLNGSINGDIITTSEGITLNEKRFINEGMSTDDKSPNNYTTIHNKVSFKQISRVESVSYRTLVSGTHTLNIKNEAGTTVLQTISVNSLGDSWIKFNLSTPLLITSLSITSGVKYIFEIVKPLSAVYITPVNTGRFNGTYWENHEALLLGWGTSTSRTNAMSFEFSIAPSGEYIPPAISLYSKPIGIILNYVSNIPVGTNVIIETILTKSDTSQPSETEWVSQSNGGLINNILYAEDLEDKFLWLRYKLIGSLDNQPVVTSVSLEKYITTSNYETFFLKTSDSWFGVFPIAILVRDDVSLTPYARVKITTPSGENFYEGLTWDASRKRLLGKIRVGSWYNIGCADPNIGNYSLVAEVSEDSVFQTIVYSDNKTFSTYKVNRRSGIDGIFKYTQFNMFYDGYKWQHSIRDYGVLADDTTSRNNVTVAIPFHPITAQISIHSVTINNKLVDNGGIHNNSQSWWWDSEKHTLYVLCDSISTSGLSATNIGIDFESDTDLFATRYDTIKTENIGERKFWNGLMLTNSYYSTFILGGTVPSINTGFSGMQVDTRVRKSQNNMTAPPVSVDCIERVSVHVDGISNIYNLGDYPANIRWKHDEWKNIIHSENNHEITIKNLSSPTEWEQQKQKGIEVERILSLRAENRYGKQDYKLTNKGSVSRILPFVWGKEPWAGKDRTTNDEGRFAGDTQSRIVDSSIPIESLPKRWMIHYDKAEWAGMGLLFPQIVNGTAYFLKTAPISKTDATYPIPVESYPTINYVENVFFETTFNEVAPNTSVFLSFYQGQYSGTSWNDLERSIEDDYQTLMPISTEIQGQTLRALTLDTVTIIPNATNGTGETSTLTLDIEIPIEHFEYIGLTTLEIYPSYELHSKVSFEHIGQFTLTVDVTSEFYNIANINSNIKTTMIPSSIVDQFAKSIFEYNGQFTLTIDPISELYKATTINGNIVSAITPSSIIEEFTLGVFEYDSYIVVETQTESNREIMFTPSTRFVSEIIPMSDVYSPFIYDGVITQQIIPNSVIWYTTQGKQIIGIIRLKGIRELEVRLKGRV